MLRLGHAGFDFCQDGFGRFAARIIVGQNHDIGIAFGHVSHQRTLAAIAVAPAAKHTMQPPALAAFAQGQQDFFQRIRGVGIVHQHGGAAGAMQALQAPGDRLHQRQMLHGLGKTDATHQ